jgi:hypothetical protein
VIVSDPTYAGIVNRVHLAGGTARFAPFRVVDGEWRLHRERSRPRSGEDACD